MTTTLVGPIVGPIAAPAEAGASTTDVGQGVDFAIGGLEFQLAISDERPYERATAQFRKDQFDSTPTVGDQSLTGWWAVSQFSFHKGASIKYYDASDDTLTNRYFDSQGIDPFSEIGEISLSPEWTNTTSSGPFGAITWGGSANGFLALMDSAVLKYATSLTGAMSSYTPTAGSAQQATVGPLCAYITTTANKIERVGIAVGAPASGALYTHSTAFQRIFYAKDRLWVVDNDNVWYQLSPNPAAPPVAIAAGDKVFTAGDAWDTSWTLADTPGPVLIGNGPRIYAISLTDTGAVPSLSGPVIVAELPPGEYIRAMAYHLGFLAISTNVGVRIGIVSEAGQVTYGPVLIEWTNAIGVTQIARRGSSVVFAGNAGLYEVDLAQQVGDGLEFGWCRLPDPYTDFEVGGTNTAHGVFSWGGTTLIAWASRALPSVLGSLKHEGSNLASTGFLTTGYLRYGTLEPKQFHSVMVRSAGTGGSITVSRVMADGSIVDLLVIDGLAGFSDPITLGLGGTNEMIALKFTLTRDAADATKGPTLLGYQVKALPAPKRQRLIRVPLKLFDIERRGTAKTTGREGSAWDRLEALEDMEQTGGVFTFQDFRTGEAGECYIESVEHKGVAPPGKQGHGFGGVIWLTVRKL